MIALIIFGCLDKGVRKRDGTQISRILICAFQRHLRHRLIIHAVPYNADAGQSSTWRAVFEDGSSVDFEMGRATMGQVNLTSDGTWGAVAQENGSIGVFQVLANTSTSLKHNGYQLMTVRYCTQRECGWIRYKIDFGL